MTIKVYMCGVQWQEELRHIPDQINMYHSVKELKSASKCWKECGIVEVDMTVSEWVEPQKLRD